VGSKENITQINTGRLYTHIQSATCGAGVKHGSHINSSLQFFSQTNHARKSTLKILWRDCYFQPINVEKTTVRGTMDTEINNIIYMELYSGPEITHGKYGKTNVAGSLDRDSTLFGKL
jgi:hypothetical protein